MTTAIEKSIERERGGMDRREFLAAAAGLALTAPVIARAAGSADSPPDSSSAVEFRAQRLSWAGVKLVLGNATLLIDPIITDIWDGANPNPIVPLNIETRNRYVLVTHLHNDHYDKAAIGEAISERGRVVCASESATDVASNGFAVRSVDLWEPTSLGGFSVVAVPAVDGFGAEQVSWIVSGGGKRIIHCGDTLWHGMWWRIAKQYGPFDAAFLPINGVRGYWTDPPSELPGSMTPEQAVGAAVILGAKQITPIHYGFSDPGMYVEYPNAEPTLLATAKERGMPVEKRAAGEWLEWKANT